ncbi:transcriptional regulator with XRE-family HTH domain [Brevibacillus aydinogluensis]|jgi:transcriptional regulator with XRE-family HTH domain|uniref:helix-turn-helix domain-containing protein n=1 Tax=Brevibacillus aydinogluensis TaxID=927786 RepID=UPI002892FE0F|nr:helix-turn-helix domain-containing protein [Brevibacillus aydinogluensis]MDT3417202.1 transcriptional regulator with XRE-family HTH domain [Brevibacillus aydinogluensis]
MTSARSRKLFGARLREIRHSRGYTLEQVCTLTGDHVTKNHLSEIESGKCVPRLDTLRPLVDVLEADIEEIYLSYIAIKPTKSSLMTIISMGLEKHQKKLVFKASDVLCRLAKTSSDPYHLAFSLYVRQLLRSTPSNKTIGIIAKLLLQNKRQSIFSFLEIAYHQAKLVNSLSVFRLLMDLIINKIAFDDGKMVKIWYWYAQSLYFNQMYIKALKYCELAYQKLSHVADVTLKSYILLRLGNILLQLKAYSDSLDCYKECIAILGDDLTNPNVLGSYCNIGRIHLLQQEFEKSRYYYKKVVSLSEDKSLVKLNALSDWCFAEIKLRNCQAAKRLLEESEIILHSLNTVANRYLLTAEHAFYHRNKALILSYEGDGAGAKEHLFKAIEFMEKSHLKDEIINLVFLFIEFLEKHTTMISEADIQRILLLQGQL